MNAVEFIKQYGWGEANKILREIPVVGAELYSNMCYLKNAHSEGDVDHFVLFSTSSNCWVESSSENKSFIDDALILKDLKQLVDAWELVHNFGGLKRAKRILKKAYTQFNAMVSVVWNDKPFQCTIEQLEQAIELVESVK